MTTKICLVRYGLKDKHSDMVFCTADSPEELREEFDISQYEIVKQSWGYNSLIESHELIKQELVTD